MKLDDLNWEILNYLQQNARQSNTEIAKKIGISSTSVAERIKKMEELGILTGYHASLSFAKAGYNIKTMITIEPKLETLDSFVKMMKNGFKEVINCYRVTGATSYFLEAVFISHAHLEIFLDRILDFGLTTTYVVLSETTRNKPIVKKENLIDYSEIEKRNI